MSMTLALAQLETTTGRMLRNAQSSAWDAVLFNAGVLLQQISVLLKTELPTDTKQRERWDALGLLIRDNAGQIQMRLADVEQFPTVNGIIVETIWISCMLDVLCDAMKIKGHHRCDLKLCRCEPPDFDRPDTPAE